MVWQDPAGQELFIATTSSNYQGVIMFSLSPFLFPIFFYCFFVLLLLCFFFFVQLPAVSCTILMGSEADDLCCGLIMFVLL